MSDLTPEEKEEIVEKTVDALRKMCLLRGLDLFKLPSEQRELLVAAFQEGVMFAKDIIKEK